MNLETQLHLERWLFDVSGSNFKNNVPIFVDKAARKYGSYFMKKIIW